MSFVIRQSPFLSIVPLLIPALAGCGALATEDAQDAGRPHASESDGGPRATSEQPDAGLAAEPPCRNGFCLVNPTPSEADLVAVTVGRDGVAFAVGGAQAFYQSGTVLRHDGRAWSELEAGATGPLQAAWAASSKSVWVGGLWDLRHYDGHAWRAFSELGETPGIVSITGTAEDDVWIATANGGIHHWDGTTLSSLRTSGSGSVRLVSAERGKAWAVVGRPGESKSCHTDIHAVTKEGVLLAATAENQCPGATVRVGERDLWVASGESILHFDGATLRSKMALPPSASDQSIRALASTGTGEVIAVGSAGFAARWDGNQWVAEASHTYAALSSVASRPGGGYWAVGSSGTVLERRADSWSRAGGSIADVSAASLGMESGLGFSRHVLSATGPGDIWAVNAAGAVAHYDGTQWTARASTGLVHTLALWPIGANDAIAVGSPRWADRSSASSIVRWTGSDWATVPHPKMTGLAGIWGSSPTDIWAVGSGGDPLHFDGATWTSSPMALRYVSWPLNGITGTSRADVWAIGDRGLIFHFDGDRWSVSYDALITQAVSLHSIVALAPNDVWVVGGRSGPPGTQKSILLHYDGTRWTDRPEVPTRDASLDRIREGADGKLWITSSRGLYRGSLAEGWSAVATRLGRRVQDVYSAPDGTTWTLGDKFTLLRGAPQAR